jgi:hypothetical protein
MLQKVTGSWQKVEKSELQQGNCVLPKKIIYPVSPFQLSFRPLTKHTFSPSGFQ